jgi:hypothetical protein
VKRLVSFYPHRIGGKKITSINWLPSTDLMCATHGSEMTQRAQSCRSEEVDASDFQRRITHAVRGAEQLEPVPSAAAASPG